MPISGWDICYFFIGKLQMAYGQARRSRYTVKNCPPFFLKCSINWKYNVIKHISRLFVSLDTIKKKSFSVTLFLFLYSNRSWTTTKQYEYNSLHRMYRNILVTWSQERRSQLDHPNVYQRQNNKISVTWTFFLWFHQNKGTNRKQVWLDIPAQTCWHNCCCASGL